MRLACNHCKTPGCRLCYFYETSPAHRQLFDPPAPPVPTASSFDLPQPYLINLYRRSDRLEEVTATWAKTGLLPFKRFAALDGYQLPLPPNWIAGPGAYGCKLSHCRILEEAISNNAPSVMIFEDDVVFAQDFAHRFQHLRSILPLDTHAVFLGGQDMPSDLPLPTDVPGLLRSQNTHRTQLFWITDRVYMKHLYQLWRDGNTHIDHLWGQNQKQWKVYGPREWLCGQSRSKSDINGRQLGERWWHRRKVATSTPDSTTCIPCKKNTGQSDDANNRSQSERTH